MKNNYDKGINTIHINSKWINNGEINKRIKKDELLPIGFKYGKIQKRLK